MSDSPSDEVRIRQDILKAIERAAVEADKTVTDWLNEAALEKLSRVRQGEPPRESDYYGPGGT
jgi:uncharacterized protein (DUF1778 family)